MSSLRLSISLTGTENILLVVRALSIHGAASQLDGFKVEFKAQGKELNDFLMIYSVITTQDSLSTSNKKLDKLLSKVENQSEGMKTLTSNIRKSYDQINQMQYA